jgi:hypothetical protein
VRPYWLVDDIEAAVAAAVQAGGDVAHPPMEIPGHGTFAIYIAAEKPFASAAVTYLGLRQWEQEHLAEHGEESLSDSCRARV